MAASPNLHHPAGHDLNLLLTKSVNDRPSSLGKTKYGHCDIANHAYAVGRNRSIDRTTHTLASDV